MDELLTVDQVCGKLHVTRSTWDKWRTKGVGPEVVKLPNGSLRIRRGDLEAWIEGCSR